MHSKPLSKLIKNSVATWQMCGGLCREFCENKSLILKICFRRYCDTNEFRKFISFDPSWSVAIDGVGSSMENANGWMKKDFVFVLLPLIFLFAFIFGVTLLLCLIQCIYKVSMVNRHGKYSNVNVFRQKNQKLVFAGFVLTSTMHDFDDPPPYPSLQSSHVITLEPTVLQSYEEQETPPPKYEALLADGLFQQFEKKWNKNKNI